MKIVIVGAGKLGIKVAESLVTEDIDVTVMDINDKVLERLNEHLDILTIEASGIDINALKEIEIGNFDLLVAATNNDETNTVICSLAKKLGCKKTIARIRNPLYKEQWGFVKEQMGIDEIVNPDLATAVEIERELLNHYGFSSDVFADGKVEKLDFKIDNQADLVGKKLMELKGFEHLLIAAISRQGETIIPDGSTELLQGDVIHIIGKKQEIKKITSSFKDVKHDKKIENVMIVGGGNIAYYLAQRLAQNHIQVTIVEQNKERCHELSEELEDAVIIHGDGTDIHLLEEESLENMDAFIGATGFDEENLLMALMAKQSGVAHVVAKISRSNYTKIIDRLNIDVAINPVFITASNILKFIRGGQVLSVSLFLEGDAEITEIVLDDKPSIVDKPLVKLNLPKGILIGAIVRKGKVIIPKGDTILKAEDRIIIFSLNEDLPTLKMFFSKNKGGIFNELWNRAKSSRDNSNN